MKLSDKIAVKCYAEGLKEESLDLKFHMLWRALYLISEASKPEGVGVRQGIRALIESNIESFDGDVDFEDNRLDIFYERPMFADGRIEEGRDIYYYQDFNTNRVYRSDDDYVLSIRSFQRILEESDMISFYMTIFKIYDLILSKTDDRYSQREIKLMEGSIYLLECALKNLMED